jgi:hypothetical protein
MSEHKFEIVVGDWSGDGHGQNATFVFTANKPIEAVREAYFAAKERLPHLCPETYADEYEDRSVPDETWEALKVAGCPLPDDRDDWDSESMARVVAWFCMQGDADLKIEYTPKSALPMLAFYGYDDKKRHIGFIGYGFFGG